MLRALALAERGRFSVSPNPMVGCVLVKDGRVIGEGFHAQAGQPHAEVEALTACTESPEGATAYVTLSPCNHTGRTPPCTEALASARVARVVVAVDDPNSIARESGRDFLLRHGIEVEVGVLMAEATRLNEKFLYAVTNRTPFVLLKAAMSLDGKLATVLGDSQWITSEAAREKSLELREEYDAILLGGGTVIADDPRLTRRLGRNNAITPWLRVILDGGGRVPSTSRVLADGGRTLIYTSRPERIAAHPMLEIVKVPRAVEIPALLTDLYSRGVQSVIVEGGPLVHSAFVRERLWQKLTAFVAPCFVGGDAPAILQKTGVTALRDAERFRFDACEMVGSDLMVTAYPA